jgi:Transposase domain (DUF772)
MQKERTPLRGDQYSNPTGREEQTGLAAKPAIMVPPTFHSAKSGADAGGGAHKGRLVALRLYGCIRGLGSAREPARRCQESAAFRWLCGGVTVNHRLLSDFRTDHGPALDGLFTQVIASLVDQDVVKVSRVSQDGVRVRVSAGASSFRREERLQELLHEAKKHVVELRRQVELPDHRHHQPYRVVWPHQIVRTLHHHRYLPPLRHPQPYRRHSDRN